jgi:hypothetical protein
MQFRAPSSELIRVVVIILFFAISVIFRARKNPMPAKPATGAAKASPLDTLRVAMRQASEQNRARQKNPADNASPFQMQESVQQPPTIEPESSIVPSLLLFALFACLCFMAYRYFAR